MRLAQKKRKFYSLSHALYIVYFATKKNMVIKLSSETLAIQWEIRVHLSLESYTEIKKAIED